MNLFPRKVTHMRSTTLISGAAALLLAAPLLSGCSPTPDTAADGAPSAVSVTDAVQLQDGWAKASSGMSGVFGTLRNDTETDLIIDRVESPAAGMIELHEVPADGVMRKIEGDVTIPAGGVLELVPGGTHIMLMQMPTPLVAGEDVTLTIFFTDGSSVEVTVLVKDYSGANEEYAPGDDEAMEEGSHATEDGEHAAS